MNITDEIKEQILINDDDKKPDKRAFLCALVKCLGSLGIEGGKAYLTLESKHKLPVITAISLIKELCGAEIEYGNAEGKTHYVRAEGAEAAKIMNVVGEGRFFTELGATDNINSRAEAAAYARGAFLASGSAYIPSEEIAKKSAGYHVEFLFFGEDAAEEFRKLLERCAIRVHLVKKGNYYGVYAKSAEAVSDVLAFLGADESVIRITAVSITREMNGVANRKKNCDFANMEKTVDSAMRQIEAIERLEATGEYDKLDEKLKETCRVRKEHSDASLSELAEMLGISKSGLNHRLERIVRLGEKR